MISVLLFHRRQSVWTDAVGKIVFEKVGTTNLSGTVQRAGNSDDNDNGGGGGGDEVVDVTPETVDNAASARRV
jgi:hypothetical protein